MPKQTAVLYAVLFSMAVTLQTAQSQRTTARTGETRTAEASELAWLWTHMDEARQESRAHSRAYTITRVYRLFEEDNEKPKSEVIARVGFVPPDKKTYAIERVEGSNRGAEIVERILNSEREMAGPNSPAAITPENYDFRMIGEQMLDGQPCYVLALTAKRKEKNLVNGAAWVDKNSYLIHEVEGDMAKSPSWWLKKVHLRIQFGNSEGMWLQTSTKATAEVRFLGKHTLTSEALQIRTADLEAGVTQSSDSPRALRQNSVVRHVSRTATLPAQESVKKRSVRPLPTLGSGVLLKR